MNGVRFHRISRGLTRCALYRETGVAPKTISNMEALDMDSESNRLHPRDYITLGNYFGVPIDELLRGGFPELEEPAGCYNLDSELENPRNCITIYRKKNKLSLRTMGDILGVSYQTVSTKCREENAPEEYVRILAKRENISIDEFYKKYREAE